MRAISRPEFDIKSVFEACVTNISDHDLQIRLTDIASNIVAAAELYDQKAQAKRLIDIQANDQGDNQVVVGAVTKKELKDLYSQHMVGAKKPARRIYDELIGSAPLGKCPFCGFGQASTLDHYLPKAKFPCLSVLPLNLVPACKDCNTGKTSRIALSAGQQALHPYYDHSELISEQWLYARVQVSSPTSIQYFVSPPDSWNEVSKQRVKGHFDNYGLSKRFSIEAANEISILNSLLLCYVVGTSGNAVNEYLASKAHSEYASFRNSWKTAMYQALANSVWFCSGGFNNDG